MPNNNNKKNKNRGRGQKDNGLVSVKNFATRRIRTSNERFPEYKANPAVQRLVRLVLNVDSVTPNADISAADLAQADANAYNLSGVVSRYTKVRVESIRIYLNTSDLDPSPSLSIVNLDGDQYTDSANPGATILSVGLIDSLDNRATIRPTTSTSVIYTCKSDTPKSGVTGVAIIAFVMCQFS